MVRHIEEQDLRGTHQQRGFDARRILRKARFEELANEMPQGPDPPQHGCDQLAHQRAVAVGERCQSGMLFGAVELRIEWTMTAQHVVEDVGGNAAGG